MQRSAIRPVLIAIVCTVLIQSCKDPEQELIPPAVTIGDVATGTVPVDIPLVVSTDSVGEVGTTQAKVYCHIPQPEVNASALERFGVYVRISSSQNAQALPGVDLGGGRFRVALEGLSPSTQYAVRAYGQLPGQSEVLGQELMFETLAPSACNGSTMTDLEGNSYPVVTIAGRCWMASNLRTTRYADSTLIQQVGNAWSWQNESQGAAISYFNSSSNVDPYGRLYNGQAVRDSVCPFGWSVPTDDEWRALESALDMTNTGGTDLREEGEVGRKLKSNSGWTTNDPAANSTGFNALPGGMRSVEGNFEGLGEWAHFWTRSESSGDQLWTRSLSANTVGVYRRRMPARSGLSVRCIKDQ
jgi:uncharacterized protein (TIGR02145 family)